MQFAWGPKQEAILRSGYAAGAPATDLARHIGASVSAVRNRASKLRLRHRTTTRTLAERFNDYVLPEPNSGCWLWDGACDKKGYGQLRLRARGPKSLRYATHISLELAGRSVGPGMQACHHCDNPACVNPDHLFIGTQLDNIRDCMAKGRKTKPPPAVAGRVPLLTHCYRGHSYSGDNLFVTSTGARQCKECKRINKRAWRRRRV